MKNFRVENFFTIHAWKVRKTNKNIYRPKLFARHKPIFCPHKRHKIQKEKNLSLRVIQRTYPKKTHRSRKLHIIIEATWSTYLTLMTTDL